MKQGWIGVDLDGTLAMYSERHGIDAIGNACMPMLKRIRDWLAAGIEVRIITARGGDASLKSFVGPWLREHNLPDLKITNSRDLNLLQIWDDRAVQVETNTAAILTPKQFVPLVPSGWIGVELDGTLAQATEPQSLSALGEPVSVMLNRVRQWLMLGMDVRIFSSRAAEPAQLPLIAEWLAQHGLQLPVTCKKDFQMSVFYDDRAVHVTHNSGEPSVSSEAVPPLRFDLD